MKKTVIIFLMMILAGLFFVAPAVFAGDLPDVDILPGSFWYPFKMLWEDIVTLFTFNDLSLAERYLSLAEERLAEIKALEIRKNYEQARKTLIRYQNTLQKAKEAIAYAKQAGENVDGVINKGVEFAEGHIDELQSVYDNAPDNLKKVAGDALNSTEQSRKEWLNTLKNQFKDQIFNHGKENTKNLKQLNNDLKDNIVPKMPNLKNMFIQ